MHKLDKDLDKVLNFINQLSDQPDIRNSLKNYPVSVSFKDLYAGGFYTSLTDTIYVNQKILMAIDYSVVVTMLHELAHWSGHPSRLNRRHIAFCFARFGTYINEHETKLYFDMDATEEAIAQFTMHRLASYLGFDRGLIDIELYNYLALYPNANLIEARSESSRAFDFILSLAQPERIAA